MEHRLPREAVESPSMEIFKTCPDTHLCNNNRELRWPGGWT